MYHGILFSALLEYNCDLSIPNRNRLSGWKANSLQKQHNQNKKNKSINATAVRRQKVSLEKLVWHSFSKLYVFLNWKHYYFEFYHNSIFYISPCNQQCGGFFFENFCSYIFSLFVGEGSALSCFIRSSFYCVGKIMLNKHALSLNCIPLQASHSINNAISGKSHCIHQPYFIRFGC